MKKFSAGALLALTLAGVLLLAGCDMLPSLLPPTSEAGTSKAAGTSQAQVATPSSPAAPSTAPQSTAPPAAEGFAWTVEPYLNYELMTPVYDYYRTGTKQQPFINALDSNGLWSLLSFEGDVIFEPNEEGPVSVCGDEHAHGVPFEYERMYMEGQDTLGPLTALGFPYEVWGGHGVGGDLVYYYFPATGEYVLYGGEGPMSPVSTWGEYADQVKVPAVVPFVVMPEGISTDEELWDVYDLVDWTYGLLRSSNEEVLLPAEYQVGTSHGGYYPVFKGDKLAYFSIADARLITDLVYETTWMSPNGYWQNLGFFSEGYCPVNQGGLFGFIDESGAEVIPPQFEGATHVYGGKAWVKQNGLWGQIELTV